MAVTVYIPTSFRRGTNNRDRVELAAPDIRQLIKCRNIQDQLHAKDPQRHPRDARTAYFIDPQDLLKIGRLEGDGFDIAVIYHSHVDAGAYFSPTDKQQALIGGEPTYPAATYIVTSVVGGRAEASAGFRWNSGERDFPTVVAAVTEAAARGTSYGAPTALEVEMAEAITAAYPSIELVRLVSSGTEAALSAIRVARGATGRELLLKFDGCYHGHSDSLLVKAGSGGATFSIPDSAGVPARLAQLTLTAAFNDLDGVRALSRARGRTLD